MFPKNGPFHHSQLGYNFQVRQIPALLLATAPSRRVFWSLTLTVSYLLKKILTCGSCNLPKWPALHGLTHSKAKRPSYPGAKTWQTHHQVAKEE